MSEHCSRCQGLLIDSETVHTEEGRWSFSRCMNCGHQFDAVVLYHHSLSAAPEPFSTTDLPIWNPERHLLQWQQRRAEEKLSQIQHEVD